MCDMHVDDFSSWAYVFVTKYILILSEAWSKNCTFSGQLNEFREASIGRLVFTGQIGQRMGKSFNLQGIQKNRYTDTHRNRNRMRLNCFPGLSHPGIDGFLPARFTNESGRTGPMPFHPTAAPNLPPADAFAWLTLGVFCAYSLRQVSQTLASLDPSSQSNVRRDGHLHIPAFFGDSITPAHARHQNELARDALRRLRHLTDRARPSRDPTANKKHPEDGGHGSDSVSKCSYKEKYIEAISPQTYHSALLEHSPDTQPTTSAKRKPLPSTCTGLEPKSCLNSPQRC